MVTFQVKYKTSRKLMKKKTGGRFLLQARQFVQHAFGQLSLSNDAYLQKNQFSNIDKYERESTESKSSVLVSDTPPQLESSLDGSLNDTSSMDGSNLQDFGSNNAGKDNGNVLSVVPQIGDRMQSDKYFGITWLGFPAPEKINWDGFDLLKGIGLQSRRIAEATYIESGLATPKVRITIQSSLPDIKKATQDIMSQTDSILGALMVLTAAVSQLNKEGRLSGKDETKENDSNKRKMIGSVVDERKAEEMKALFSKAETAMEAWAMLATSLGHPSFIKSEFEKICFLDNPSTDTQVAIYVILRRRLVVAFREQNKFARWKDLRTDLMLVPAGLNPERIGGDFKQEIQVHSGFLSAYDSVRTRIISLIKLLVGYIDDGRRCRLKWHVYVIGHSLGGALATLLALELSSSQLAKRGVISVTMYNFGSPRVGNKRFAEVYNEKVKDSWRVVNHRDIIPTVPRLMGYCHVAQPVYLAAGDIRNALNVAQLIIRLKMRSGNLHSHEHIPNKMTMNFFIVGTSRLILVRMEQTHNLISSVNHSQILSQSRLTTNDNEHELCSI
ncbi:hypothetical protein AAG906_016884 [Vitis piasezkii]